MLAEERRGRAEPHRRPREAEDGAGLHDLAELRVGVAPPVAVGARLLVVDEAGEDRARDGRDGGRAQGDEELGEGEPAVLHWRLAISRLSRTVFGVAATPVAVIGR